jgi:hypothetical protein
MSKTQSAIVRAATQLHETEIVLQNAKGPAAKKEYT